MEVRFVGRKRRKPRPVHVDADTALGAIALALQVLDKLLPRAKDKFGHKRRSK